MERLVKLLKKKKKGMGKFYYNIQMNFPIEFKQIAISYLIHSSQNNSFWNLLFAASISRCG